MKTITRIAGVDCKIGRNSRTGSTLSMTIDDIDIIDVVAYFNDIKAGKDPSGKIKKIELILYSDDAREKIKSGVNKLANAVSITLGPRGRHTMIRRSWGAPHITRDGVTIAREIFFKDQFAVNCGKWSRRQAGPVVQIRVFRNSVVGVLDANRRGDAF